MVRGGYGQTQGIVNERLGIVSEGQLARRLLLPFATRGQATLARKEFTLKTYATHYLLAALAASTALAGPASAEIFWSDTYLSVRHLWQDKQPGYAGNVAETAGNIAYANGWTYGSNFASLDLENFGHQDPANSAFGKGKSDSFEFYGVFRTVLSGNKISGTKNFAFGPFSDVGLEF